MLYRYSEYKGSNPGTPVSADFAKFPDVNSVSSWVATATKWAHAEGLIQGMGNGTLSPGGFASRTQAATVFMRYCEGITG